MAKSMSRAEFNSLKGNKPAPKTISRSQFNKLKGSKPNKTYTRAEFKALSQKKPGGVRGLASNFKKDFGSFAKGMIGIGKELVTHPVYNAKQIGGVGKELIKGLPQGARDFRSSIYNYPETQRKGIEAFKQLRKTPLSQQKAALAKDIEKIRGAKGDKSKKKLAELGLGLFGDYSQYSRLGEKAYEEPFTATLDALSLGIPVAKSGTAAKIASKAKKLKPVAKVTDKASDIFLPQGKLRRLGYGEVADDVSKTGANIRRSQEGIIKSTINKFDKDFKLSKAEKTEFFETIDKGRRTEGYVPISPNAKVQGAIDWYLKEELPKIQKIAGYGEGGEKLYRGGKVDGSSFSKDKGVATDFAKNRGGDVKEYSVSKNAKIVDYKDVPDVKYKNLNDYSPELDIGDKTIWRNLEKEYIKATDWAKQNGYDAIRLPLEGETRIINKKVISKVGQPPIENYLHHIFKPTGETKFGSKLSSPQRGFLKKSKDVEGFSKDPVVSIAGVKSKAATANIKQGFIDRLSKKYGKADVQEFKNGRAIGQDGEELAKYKGKYLPKDLTDELSRLDSGEPGWLKTVLEPARAFNRNWKPLATAVRPRYHLRNVIGNVYNASFIGGAKPQRYLQAVSQQMKGFIAQNIKDGSIAGKLYKSLFKQAPEHKFLKMAVDDDVVGRGFFTVDINDISDVAETAQDFSKAIAKTKNPSAIYKVPVLRQWMQGMQKFGSAIEDNARLALYIDRLKKGASRVDAKKYTNKHLFDYLTGLGEADKFIKAFIPFWSWRRFNVPLQLGAIGKNPLRHLAVQQGGKGFVAEQEANPEYQFLNQRTKDMGAVKTGETVDEEGNILDKYMRTQNVLPIQDVSGLTDPDNMGFSPLANMLKQGRNYIFPPEDPNENLTYFGRPAEQFPGEVKNYLGGNVRGTTKEIIQSIPLLSEINKLTGGSYTDANRPDLATRIESVLNPMSSTVQNRDKNREYFVKDFERKTGTGTFAPGFLSELKYFSKKVIENPNDSAANKNFRTLINLMKDAGMPEKEMQDEINKAVQAALKIEKPKPKRPASLRPKRPTPLLDPYYEDEVRQRAGSLNPFFTN